MEKKEGNGFFLTLVAFSLVLLLLDRNGALSFIRGFLEQIISPAERAMHAVALPKPDEAKMDAQEALVLLKKLEKENEDLRLELGIARPSAQKLLLAHVLSTGRYFIIDKGSDDGIQEGQSVIFKNVFVGKILVISKKTSRVLLPIEKDSVVGVKDTQTGAIGNVYGKDGQMQLLEVTLPEALKEEDMLETVGAVDEKGLGIRPGLHIGRISQIRKSDNQLFQEATILPLLEFKTLENVFVIE